MLVRTLPTLCKTLVATSPIPAIRELSTNCLTGLLQLGILDFAMGNIGKGDHGSRDLPCLIQARRDQQLTHVI